MINFIRSLAVLTIVLFGLPTFKAFGVDAAILPQGVTQFLDDDGNPLSVGKVYFYVPNTLTFKTTWQNAAKSITNTNPVDLDAGGRAIIYGEGSYRQIVKNADGDTIYDAVTTAPLTAGTASLVGDGNLVSTVLPWAGLTAPAQYLFGYGQEISRASYPEFFTAITSTQTVGCTLSSPTITGLSDTSNLIAGTAVELSCVAPGTTVLSKTLTTATLSASSSASTTASATFFPWGNGNGSTTFNVPDLRGYNLAGRDNMGGTASARLVNGNGLGRPLGLSNFTYTALSPTNVTTQVFTSGTAQTYTTPAGVTKLVVTMVGGGGGGGAVATNNGGVGGTTSFSNWTADHGGGGVAGSSTRAGGTGGSAGSIGTGTQIIRLPGQGGQNGTVALANLLPPNPVGGSSPFSGGGLSYAAITNSGSGGYGGIALSSSSGGGGGAGEYVQFSVSSPAATYTYTVGAAGVGGPAGTAAGGNGSEGVIIVQEYYTTTPSTTSFIATTAGTLEQQRTINYVVKVTPDTSTSIATGVTSLGGMTGVITCGTGLLCTGNVISSLSGVASFNGKTGIVEASATDKVVYVSTAGNDGNNGLSPESAFLTIQAAINSISSNGKVYVGTGTYTLSATIGMKPYITLECSPGTTITQANSANLLALVDFSGYIAGSDAYGSTIQNCWLDGNKDNNTNTWVLATETQLIYYGNTDNVTIDNNTLTNSTGYGIRGSSQTYLRVSRNTITNVQAHGIFLVDTGANFNAYCTVVNNSLDAPLLVEGLNGCLVDGNRIIATLIGGVTAPMVVSISGTTVTWVSGPTFSTALPGMVIIADDGSAQEIIKTVNSSTSLTLNASAGTHTSKTAMIGHNDLLGICCSEMIVSNNYMRGGASYGLSLGGIVAQRLENSVFSNNVMENQGKSGFALLGDSGAGGIGARNLVITGNNVINAIQGGRAGCPAVGTPGCPHSYVIQTDPITNVLLNGNSARDATGLTYSWLGLNSLSAGSIVIGPTNQQFGAVNPGIYGGSGTITLSAGWGNTAATSAVISYGSSIIFTITSGGTGQGANPTVSVATIASKPTQGANATYLCKMVGGTGTITTLSGEQASTPSAITMTFGGTPVAASTYQIICQ